MGPDLYQAIASAPTEWIDLGQRLSSKIIFKDAFIHLVGRYMGNEEEMTRPGVGDEHSTGPRTTINSLNVDVRELIESKAAGLRMTCRRAERKLIRYHLAHLFREPVSNEANRNNKFTWIALGLFRHYIRHAILKVRY